MPQGLQGTTKQGYDKMGIALLGIAIACFSAGLTCFAIALHMRLETYLHNRAIAQFTKGK